MKFWYDFLNLRSKNLLENKESFEIEELYFSKTPKKGQLILQHGFMTLKLKGSEFYINLKKITGLVFSK